MRILTLSNCPLVASQGSGYVTQGFCDRLRARDHEVEIFGPETLEIWPNLQGRARSYRQALGMLRFCLRHVKKHNFDIVEFWGGESWLAARILSRWKQRPLLVSHSNGLETHCAEVLRSYHDTSKEANNDANSRRWYHLDQSRWMGEAFTRVDGLVTVSNYDADYARRHDYQPSQRIVAIENSLPDEFLSLQVEWSRAPVIGFCGSWIERKGTTIFCEAIHTVLREHPDARVLLVGVGEAFPCEKWFPGICERIEVVPFVQDKSDLRALYTRMSVFVLPSQYESFGLTAAEAMACGCALVATRTGFAAGLNHGEEALLLNQHLSSELEQILRQLLSDEELRRTIARGGYERAQRLRWSDAVVTLEQAYSVWLQEKAGNHRAINKSLSC